MESVISSISSGLRASRRIMAGVWGLGLLLSAAAFGQDPNPNSASSRVPAPHVDAAQGGSCVQPPEVMRRTHMELLKHQRDRSVREGHREPKLSLNACIDCHASRSNASVLGSEQNFCQGCHSYAAVKLDCFECHNPKAAAKGASALETAGMKP